MLEHEQTSLSTQSRSRLHSFNTCQRLQATRNSGWLQIRGVPVGSVLSVQPSLERVNVLAEIKDVTTVIPRNSLIEANQSGLIAEPLIDITPQLPIPDYVVRCSARQLAWDLAILSAWCMHIYVGFNMGTS